MAASLLEILEAREQRVLRQKELLAQENLPLVCFTLNIPGPEKDSPLIQKGFQLGLRLLENALGAHIQHRESRLTAAGWEGFLRVDRVPEKLKRITAYLEDRFPGGRVFDMDVLTPTGKLGRAELGISERKCLLCEKPAAICGRSRAHSLDSLQKESDSLIRKSIAEEIARLAAQSLLCEVYATPKPGLWIKTAAEATGTWIFSRFCPARRHCGPIFASAPPSVWRVVTPKQCFPNCGKPVWKRKSGCSVPPEA